MYSLSTSTSVPFSLLFYLFILSVLFFLSFLPSLCFEKIQVYKDCFLCSCFKIWGMVVKDSSLSSTHFFCLPLPSALACLNIFYHLPLDFVKHQSTLCSSHISLCLHPLALKLPRERIPSFPHKETEARWDYISVLKLPSLGHCLVRHFWYVF